MLRTESWLCSEMTNLSGWKKGCRKGRGEKDFCPMEKAAGDASQSDLGGGRGGVGRVLHLMSIFIVFMHLKHLKEHGITLFPSIALHVYI